MKPKIRLYTVDGCHYLGIIHGNKLCLISYVGKFGERINPGSPRWKNHELTRRVSN